MRGLFSSLNARPVGKDSENATLTCLSLGVMILVNYFQGEGCYTRIGGFDGLKLFGNTNDINLFCMKLPRRNIRKERSHKVGNLYMLMTRKSVEPYNLKPDGFRTDSLK